MHLELVTSGGHLELVTSDGLQSVRLKLYTCMQEWNLNALEKRLPVRIWRENPFSKCTRASSILRPLRTHW